MADTAWSMWTPISALFGAMVGPFASKLIERAFRDGQVSEALRDTTSKELCDIIDELETLSNTYWLPAASAVERDNTIAASRIVSRLHVCNQMIYELFNTDAAVLGRCQMAWQKAHAEITGQDFGEPDARAERSRLQAMSINLLNLKRLVITSRATQPRPFFS